MTDSTNTPTITTAKKSGIRRPGVRADTSDSALGLATGIRPDLIAGLPSEVVLLEQIEAFDLYQRELQTHYRTLLLGWDNRLCNDVILARRQGDDKLYVIDGHHRVQAAKELGLVAIHAKIIELSGPEEEARLFEKYNTATKKLNAQQIYQARYTAREEVTCLIEKILQEHNMTGLVKLGSNVGEKITVADRVYAVNALRSAWGKVVPTSFPGPNSTMSVAGLNAGGAILDWVVRGGMPLRTHRRERANVVYSGYFLNAMLWVRTNVANRDEIDPDVLGEILVEAGSASELNHILQGVSSSSSQNEGAAVRQGLHLVRFVNRHSPASAPLIRLTEEQAIRSAKLFDTTVYLAAGEQAVTRAV